MESFTSKQRNKRERKKGFSSRCLSGAAECVASWKLNQIKGRYKLYFRLLCVVLRLSLLKFKGPSLWLPLPLTVTLPLFLTLSLFFAAINPNTESVEDLMQRFQDSFRVPNTPTDVSHYQHVMHSSLTGRRRLPSHTRGTANRQLFFFLSQSTVSFFRQLIVNLDSSK